YKKRPISQLRLVVLFQSVQNSNYTIQAFVVVVHFHQDTNSLFLLFAYIWVIENFFESICNFYLPG
ncbi:hypothetical protein P4V64_31420, partial [Bacillus thuringiensis]|nr:hypothetical protein [Bacillus thuringiensis]